MNVRSVAILALLVMTACVRVPEAIAVGPSELCHASVFDEGKFLATGERFHPDEPLVAHKTLPLRSYVRVTVLATGRSAVLQVRDRGPFVPGRCVDASRGAARLLNISGTPRVRVEPVPKP